MTDNTFKKNSIMDTNPIHRVKVESFQAHAHAVLVQRIIDNKTESAKKLSRLLYAWNTEIIRHSYKEAQKEILSISDKTKI